MGRALAPLLRAAAMLSLLAAAGFAWAGAPGQGARLYDMWLRYEPLPPSRQRDLRPAMRRVACANTTADSPLATACAELSRGLSSMLQAPVPVVNASGPLAAGTLTVVTESDGDAEFRVMRYGGTVEDERARLLWAGATGALQLHGATGRAALFAAFRVLADLQLGRLAVPAGRAPGGAGVTVLRSYAPSTSLRFWNLWDNLDGVTAYQKNCDDFDRIPRSALHWDDLPNLRPRYTDMARLLSSVGVNSIVLNNVNACDEENVALMSSRYIGKAAALAKVMARHGIAAYLCPCFGSPVFVGNLTTADPVNPLVVRWWHDKVQELRRAFSGSFGGTWSEVLGTSCRRANLSRVGTRWHTAPLGTPDPHSHDRPFNGATFPLLTLGTRIAAPFGDPRSTMPLYRIPHQGRQRGRDGPECVQPHTRARGKHAGSRARRERRVACVAVLHASG